MFHLDAKMLHETFIIAYETFVASFFVIPLYICNRILRTIINNLINLMRMESIKRKFLIALFLFICIVMHAQDLVVKGTVLSASGTVLSASDNFPVIGATVVEDGNNTNGTITDIDGNFTLTVKESSSISVSFVGYQTQTMKAQSVMNFVLKEDTEVLDEVVVVLSQLYQQMN